MSLPEIQRPFRVIVSLTPDTRSSLMQIFAKETGGCEIFRAKEPKALSRASYEQIIKSLLDSGLWRLSGASEYGQYTLYAVLEWVADFSQIYDYKKALQ